MAEPEPEPQSEPEQSPEDRIAWLREHGVTVDIPADRQEGGGGGKMGREERDAMIERASQAAEGVRAEQAEAGGTSSFKYVYIAADESKPYEVRMRWHPHPVRRALTDPLDLQEVVAEAPAGGGDQLMTLLKAKFADSKRVDSDAFAQRFSGTPAANVSAASLDSAAADGSVEAFPLIRPNEQV